MTRPLVVSDCDEVLLHMVAPFRDWLDETQDIDFIMKGADFSRALTYRSTGAIVEGPDLWRLLNLFFDTEMYRQSAIEGAVAGINALAEHADVVILTNLTDERQQHRTQQLHDVGIHARVFTNQGPKGPALKAIVEEYAPSRAVFIDDLPQHHASVAEAVPDILRLHLCGEPMLAPHIDCAHAAGHAHARIDEWSRALPWLLERINGENDD